ncbi:hypothetical protein JYU34_016674 [Plutella xylostella]|uniref:Rhodanese domain-containing protein n=1 Tax=Plutella xylostella TaxID=51655 RepID=A0ABQ7Q364_PLUXY|nr:hypothetical protein JYU34_016674 [Plutella xylostella]
MLNNLLFLLTLGICWTCVELQTKTETKTELAVVDYEYVKRATSDNSILIVDVREPSEVEELGKIPNSINIPLMTVSNALGTVSDEEFLKLYGRQKPSKDAEIIFYCRTGKRAAQAQQFAVDLGYTNTKNYRGSWRDWTKHTQNHSSS